MNLNALMQKRTAEQGPIRVGVVGAGKFASMFLTQAPFMPGVHVAGVADIRPDAARAALKRTGWPEERYAAKSLDEALRNGTTAVVDSSDALFACGPIEVVLEITGNPHVGVHHALKAIDSGKHIVMVNVEADCMVGPLLARKAAAAGVVYSMAYGDQPALVCEQVDWARSIGFRVVAAGKGTKYLPEYHASTPETVWNYYGFTEVQLARGDFNPKMFNSFLDGTKSGIEMVAIANATGLDVQDQGLEFPPVGVDDLSRTLIPKVDGGVLDKKGVVEVISCLERDGSPVFRDLRWGVYVVFEAATEYAGRCFAEYGVITDKSGRYAALYRPSHLIGLELGVSIASAVLRREPTGCATAFNADVVCVGKRALKAGEILDGEGGYMVWGRAAPAAASMKMGALPLGICQGAKLKKDVPSGAVLTWSDVEMDESQLAVRVRREMEREFAPGGAE